MSTVDSFGAKKTLNVEGKDYNYYNLNNCGDKVKKMPFSLKVVLENLLRYEDNETVTKNDIENVVNWVDTGSSKHEIAYRPARILMQDFTGVPAIVDLAAMRDAAKKMNSDVSRVNPLIPVDLVIDHSVQVDSYGKESSYKDNVDIEMHRNNMRYEFLHWGQKSFNNLRVVPPGTGICHQVNLEYLAKVVWENENVLYPDTLVGTDSHTTMINGLAVLGWGVGGIEAEAAMLGQPISMLIPDVIGFKIEGSMNDGITATDVVLTVTEMLRKKGVVGKFVEFYGPGVKELSLADRATIANMAPEYGATCGFFPIDEQTIRYMRVSGRSEEQLKIVEEYAKAQGMWYYGDEDIVYTDSITLNLAGVKPSLAGPKRPQDRIVLDKVAESVVDDIRAENKSVPVKNQSYAIDSGDIIIAAITSCTNTSNPSVMIAAGLVAKKAYELGLKVKPWVKTSLAPGSKVVTEYFNKSGLQEYLDKLGFNLVGYGCTTCIGNSGPLDQELEEALSSDKVTVASVLSGNRNFEGRVHPLSNLNYLASPPLVVAYSILGNIAIDITTESLGTSTDGNPVYLKDIWPNNKEISDIVNNVITREMFTEKYKDVFSGDETWQKIQSPDSDCYEWDEKNTYIQNPPYFESLISGNNREAKDIEKANVLALLGDSVTTDHISPAGNIAKEAPAAKYLNSLGVENRDFNSYGSRRGNHNVMIRGTFANIRIRNKMADGKEGGYTKSMINNEIMSIYDAATLYRENSKDMVVVGGKEYGTGSSRDWAAKGTKLLGIKAVIAESFERIHRSNLVGVGVLPLMFSEGDSADSLGLNGSETFSISGINEGLSVGQKLKCVIERDGQVLHNIELICRLDTKNEVDYYNCGGVLNRVLLNMQG